MGKKLIEVALPLEAINKESSREKSIRHGHPSTLHLWWARRPLAAARAIIWSSLIDDPSTNVDVFPTEEEQIQERQRLFRIIEQLVVWENSTDSDVLMKAKKELIKANPMGLPQLIDPFAGGGTIPLEGQRLGLNVHAHDLNPVAVMINKAMIEIPPLFKAIKPINPNSQIERLSECTPHATFALMEDVTYYGEVVKKELEYKIGELYPEVTLPKELGGGKAKAVAWLWTRTVTCPNPACQCESPLIRNYKISKKKNNIAWVEPVYHGKNVSFSIHYSGKEKISSTISRKGGICACCGAPISFQYLREEAQAGRMIPKMFAIIAEGHNRKLFIEPNIDQLIAANIDKPNEYPNAPLPYNPRNFQTPNYGMNDFASLFSNRQLTLLTTLCDIIKSLEKDIERDAIKSGMKNDGIELSKGGKGAKAYAQAICTYLAFAVDREANYSSTLNGWSGDFIIQTFGRQAIPMVWDFAESNPFSDSTGNWTGAINWIVRAIKTMPAETTGKAEQFDAQEDCGLRNMIVSTDPPYYDNIVYADLADYFYIWMRNILHNVYPDIFKTIQVPKKEELVATAYRFGGDLKKAKNFFELGMSRACRQIYNYASDEYPITIYYAYKQSETETDTGNDKTTKVSSGWEAMLKAIIDAELMVTGTWPIHTERETGLKAHMNALATSIVLVCRKRSHDAKQITRRNFMNILRNELRPALRHLQESNIAPVDLAQSAIGPGMGVYSRYRAVVEADGTPMSVRNALKTINEEIDFYFYEQIGDLDAMSRFCVDLYTQSAFNDMKFGDADILARAKGTSVAALASHEIVYAKAGTVHLIDRTELSQKINKQENCIWILTQQLTQAMATGGVEACANAVLSMLGSNAEKAKDLAYRLYTVAEQKKWSMEAYAYNALVVAWPDIQSRAAVMQRETPEQLDMFSMGLLDN